MLLLLATTALGGPLFVAPDLVIPELPAEGLCAVEPEGAGAPCGDASAAETLPAPTDDETVVFRGILEDVGAVRIVVRPLDGAASVPPGVEGAVLRQHRSEHHVVDVLVQHPGDPAAARAWADVVTSSFVGELVPVGRITMPAPDRVEVVRRIAPTWPDHAELGQGDTVVCGAQVQLAADGSALSVEVDCDEPWRTAAASAIRQWRWNPGAPGRETRVGITFRP